VATHEIRIDRSKTLLEEPNTGHNRWHPDIRRVLRCEPGDEVVLETRDAFDGPFAQPSPEPATASQGGGAGSYR
jgi:formamidase